MYNQYPNFDLQYDAQFSNIPEMPKNTEEIN